MNNSSTYVISLLVLVSIFASAHGIAVMSVDLGSEWMKIAVVSPGKPMEIVLNKESQRKTPVAISFRHGQRLIGDAAMTTAVRFPENAYHHFLDLVGKSIDHPYVKEFQRKFPQHKMSGLPEKNTVLFHHKEGMDFTPEELISMILKKSQETAESFTEQKITDCVITVPPYFNQAERRAIVKAAEFADLKVLQLINANTAAALNYGVFRRRHFNSTPQNIMLYDMGAADTVATIISYQLVKTKEAGYVEENPQLSIKGIGFERGLGGLEMQIRLRDHLAKLFNEQKKTSTDIRTNLQAMSKLFKEAGKLKHVLSANDHFFSQVEGLMEDIDFKAKVSRQDFIDMISDMLEKTTNPIKMALDAAGMTLNDIEQLILVGGGTRVPKVQEKLIKFSKKELGKNLNTDEAPAMGAAYQAAYLSTGFKVKKFIIRESNLYPIQVDFSRNVIKDDGTVEVRQVKRMLFSHQNQYPQKKVMTFNKHVEDFHFYISYSSDIDQLIGEERKNEIRNISKIKLKNVKEALGKHTEEDTESKGIKAHFRMDESGLLLLDQVEAEFKKKVLTEEEPSTLSKLGSTISNLFSGGSSDAEKSEDSIKDETDKKKDEKESTESSKNKTEAKEDKNNSTANATADGAKKDVKQIVIKEPIKTLKKFLDIPPFGDELENTIKKRLQKLDMADKKKKEREAARNSVESFVFNTQDKLYQPEYEAATTETERENIRSKLSEASDWLEEETAEQETEVYQKKLKELKELTKDVFTRVKEHSERPEAWKALHDTLNISRLFLSSLKNISSEDSVFTEVEIETLEKIINETTKWEKEMKAEQEATPLTDVPKVTIQMIVEKIANLDREIKYLLSKSKLAKPKPKVETKPDNETEKKETKDEKLDKAESDDSEGEPTKEEETLELPGTADATDAPPDESTTKEPEPEAEETPNPTPSDEEKHKEL